MSIYWLCRNDNCLLIGGPFVSLNGFNNIASVKLQDTCQSTSGFGVPMTTNGCEATTWWPWCNIVVMIHRSEKVSWPKHWFPLRQEKLNISRVFFVCLTMYLENWYNEFRKTKKYFTTPINYQGQEVAWAKYLLIHRNLQETLIGHRRPCLPALSEAFSFVCADRTTHTWYQSQAKWTERWISQDPKWMGPAFIIEHL